MTPYEVKVAMARIRIAIAVARYEARVLLLKGGQSC